MPFSKEQKTIGIPAPLHARLKALAKQRQQNMTTLAVNALTEWLERGMPVAEVEAALEGRPYRPGRKVERCPRCGTTGYAGEYPFSSGYDALCDDCGA